MIVTSHVLGELERVCDGIVVIDGGRLLRHSTTAAVTAQTAVVSVEVLGDVEVLQQHLDGAGVAAHREGNLLHVDVGDPSAYDVVRDAVAELGLGLVRVERERHRMTEIFADAPAGTPAGTGGGRG